MRRYLVLFLVLVAIIFPIGAELDTNAQKALDESNKALSELGKLGRDPGLSFTQAYNLINLQILLDKTDLDKTADPQVDCIALKVLLTMRGYNASLDGDHVNVNLNGTTYKLIPATIDGGHARIISKESEIEWARYSGHGMSFKYPETWSITEGPTGVVVGDGSTFALSLVMHREGCYSLQQHPQLLDFMLKAWGTKMDGTPEGDPITQYIETYIGPSSVATQIYKNPNQILICGLQGYKDKNVTITFAEAIWEPSDPSWGDTAQHLGSLVNSITVTL